MPGCSRRRFLIGLGATALAARAPWLLAQDPQAGVLPEYAGELDELLFVYDQCAAPHLLRQMVEILRAAPPSARVHALVSQDREAEARQRLSSFGFEDIHWLPSTEPGLSGDWPRDIFQIGRDGERRVVHVPWCKVASSREDLDRNWRKLRGLSRPDLDVRLLPIAGEGGNLIADRRPDGNILFAGSTIAVETRALTHHYFGFDPGDDGVAQVLHEAFGLTRVVWVGPRAQGACARQGQLVFHIDMAISLIASGVAVVARCDPAKLDEPEHARLLAEEAARTLAALERRHELGMPWPEDLALPREQAALANHLEQRRHDEVQLLAEAASQMDAAASLLAAEGYVVHRIDADPRRVRRYQSETNVVVARDRLLVPLYPTTARVHGWVLQRGNERAAIDLDLGTQDSDFELVGDNLRRLQFYRKLHGGVRLVRDYFHLASGNVHCVLGRLG